MLTAQARCPLGAGVLADSGRSRSYPPRVDDTQFQVDYPQGYFLTSWLLLVASLVVLLICLMCVRRATLPAVLGAVGSLAAGLTWGCYILRDQAIRSGNHQPMSTATFADRHASVLLWTHVIGVVFVGLALVLALLALPRADRT